MPSVSVTTVTTNKNRRRLLPEDVGVLTVEVPALAEGGTVEDLSAISQCARCIVRTATGEMRTGAYINVRRFVVLPILLNDT